ncbi:DUF58 domain-containing protein [Croceiramulus getboli]|nr:DUF58 domain-containing protein [Flavobacteriaceae bacterium YJPT1-3]
MKTEYKELLKPEIIDSVEGLALISRVLVEGYLSGLNQSRRLGPGLEFSQYRGYQPGDDIRLLDWKMLARSDRYYIKQADIDTHASVRIIIDASASMNHEEGPWSKLQMAKVLAATLGNLAHKQGDGIALYALNSKKEFALPEGNNPQHFKKFLYELSTMTATNRWPKSSPFFDQLHGGGKKEMVFFITDLYEDQKELLDQITKLKTARNELIVFHLVGQAEMEFEYEGQLIFEDLETGARLKVTAKEAREHYLKGFREKLNEYEQKFLNEHIGYQRILLQESLGEQLRSFLKTRLNASQP